MKTFGGKILFLDRSDINTDEIIPAKYLTEITKEALAPRLLEDLKLDGFSHPSSMQGKAGVVTRANFGCGSSREHAPWALEVNGINAVFAENFARIFRQNMFNCGMLAIELAVEDINTIFHDFSAQETEFRVDLESSTVIFKAKVVEKSFNFNLGGFDQALVKSGGWVGYADKKY